jgi:Flp pilus assembly protein TadD
MQPKPAYPARRLLGSVSRVAIVAALAATLGACANKPNTDITGSIQNPFRTAQNDRDDIPRLAEQYQKSPADPQIAIAYAQALRRTEQRAQAVAVLEQASIKNPKHKALLGEYGRALADNGRLQQGLDVLSRAHTPDQPDWRILNAQGAIHDQLGNFKEARRYYQTALKIVPDEPSVLSNQGLSHILSKDLAQAESILRRAAAQPRADKRVRQNLALSLALQGMIKEQQQRPHANKRKQS